MKYFDGHNDVLLKFYFEKNKDSAKEFFNGNDFCHIDFPKILKSNFCGGFFAIFVPNEEPDDDDRNDVDDGVDHHEDIL